MYEILKTCRLKTLSRSFGWRNKTYDNIIKLPVQSSDVLINALAELAQQRVLASEFFNIAPKMNQHL